MFLIQIKLRLLPVLFSVTMISIAISAATPTADEMLTSAKEKGKLVAADYMSRNILPNASSFNYFEACSYYGVCIYGEAIKDTSYFKSVYTRYKSNKPASIPTGDVDKNSSGLLPLYLSKLSNDSTLLKLGKASADNSLQNKGYSRTAIDDTYMTGALMIQAYRATGDIKYLDFFAGYLLTDLDTLQQSNGLYWHKLDSKNFWGRGNGWGAASATELLLELPKTHPKYAAVLEKYKKQMTGLLAVQKDNGIWMQLLDSKDTKNWEETSGTAMFLFAIFTGMRNNWLDQGTFLEPAKKGWTALVGYLQGAKLTNVAAGFWPSTGTASDYLNASRGQPGDSHGTAAFLWAAAAVIHYFADPVSVDNRNTFHRLQAISPNVNLLNANTFFDLRGRIVPFDMHSGVPSMHSTGIILRRSTDVNGTRLKIDVHN
jgi:unsaturated rhamnogalacturonyl hydrolase